MIESHLVYFQKRQGIVDNARVMTPFAFTWAKSRTRRSRRFAILGVPRLRQASSMAPLRFHLDAEDSGGAGDNIGEVPRRV